MNEKISHVEFYYPKNEFDSKEKIVENIISAMKQSGSIEYSGYSDESVLKNSIFDHMGDGDISVYRDITQEEKNSIEKIIHNTVLQCSEHVTVPLKNYIFIYPYLPKEEDRVFGGVMAVAMYSCVFHVFISLKDWSEESLKNTVAHELNHTIYYYNHFDRFNKYTLLDNLLLEGLAENFREQYFDKKITPWAGVLLKEDALEIMKDLKEKFNSTDKELIKQVLFGGEQYKKWTGYSVGYWIVKKFREENPSVSWNELMKQDIFAFLK